MSEEKQATIGKKRKLLDDDPGPICVYHDAMAILSGRFRIGPDVARHIVSFLAPREKQTHEPFECNVTELGTLMASKGIIRLVPLPLCRRRECIYHFPSEILFMLLDRDRRILEMDVFTSHQGVRDQHAVMGGKGRDNLALVFSKTGNDTISCTRKVHLNITDYSIEIEPGHRHLFRIQGYPQFVEWLLPILAKMTASKHQSPTVMAPDPWPDPFARRL
jgi:hypothetical protein